ncbi:hypothetical protein F4801DRAFT_264358 [Xylaria longipes]|nr:hypothetical protein F4801DRAFT_264358 [Xylaria longipes]
MDGSYVPPFRRRQAAGDSGDAPPAENTSNNHSYQSTRHSGNRQGHRGYGRGGRGRNQRDFYQKQRPQLDQSDLCSPRDIHNHFWGSVDDTRDSHSSTFHDSKDRPEQLSHLLLFFGANPRWTNDHIVFAKSKLALLPEYAVKKADNGEWETEEKIHRNASAATNNSEDDAPKDKDQDVTVVPDEPGNEVVAQAGGLITSAEARDLSYSPVKKQNDLADEAGSENDIAVSIPPADLATKDDKSQVKQEITQDSDQVPAQDLTTGAQESNLSGNDEVEQFASGDSTRYEKREEQHATVKAMGVADHETQDTPIPIPSPTATTRRFKYTDIRKEEAEASLAPNQSTAPESHTKDADIHTVPANKFYHEHESFPPEPVFPAIAPIDYVPLNPLPIAIFEEQRTPGLRTGGPHARFAFKGWFKISRVNILAPHSAELVRMLQQKWGRKDRFGHVLPSRPRDASAWNSSLAVEWAVIGFQLLEGEDALPAPQIEKLPEPERPVAKGVNEMLSDMRLDDGSGDGRKDDHHATVKLDEDKINPESSPSEDPSALDK